MKTQLIGAALGAGAQDTRTEKGPAALHRRGLSQFLDQAGFALENFRLLNAPAMGKGLAALGPIAEFNTRLALEVQRSLHRQSFPIVLGGDHSIAVGTWSGVKAAAPGDLGLLWIDAHMDAHTPDTSETGAVHGMPLAALLGAGDPGLTHIAQPFPKLKPENVCLLGVRSFEKGEERFLKEAGVRVYFMDEIRRRGFDVCYREASMRVTRHTRHFGVTLDLDAFDPHEIPAVGSPVAEGLFFEEVRAALRETARDPRLIAMEIVEYNPELDPRFETFLKVYALIEDLLWARLWTLGWGRPSAPPPTSNLFLI